MPLKVSSDLRTGAAGTITASADVVRCALAGEQTVSITLAGTFTGFGFVPEFSPDGGTTWGGCVILFTSAAGGTLVTVTSQSLTAAASSFVASVPSGATHFRIRCTAISTGSVTAKVTPDSLPKTNLSYYSVQVTNSGAVAGVVTPADGVNNANQGLVVYAEDSVYNGTSWERLRTPTTFKTATATASGDTAVWTPTSGKKFRLMRYRIEATSDVATASGADIDIVLRDNTTAIGVGYSLYVPAAAVTTSPGSVGGSWIDLGNGKLSAAADNVLNINLSAALTSGKIRAVVCGTEE